MAALVMHWLVLEYTVNTKHITVGIGSDNTPTVFWTRKFAAQRSKPASRLVRVLALRLKEAEAAPLLVDHIAGDQNTMADVASRAFLSNTEHEFNKQSHKSFLHYFNSKFPLPKNLSWLEFQMTQNLISKVTSEMAHGPAEMASWKTLKNHGGSIGGIGPNSQRMQASINSLHHHQINYQKKKDTCLGVSAISI